MADEVAVPDIEVEDIDKIVEEQQAEVVEEEVEEEVEEVEEEEVKGKKEDEEEEEVETDETAPPLFKDIKAKYPELFKDFPQLRHTFFHEKEYRELFPTVEDAKEAIDIVELYQELDQSLTSGEVDGLTKVLKSIDEENIPGLAENILPALRKVSQDAYYAAVSPQIAQFAQSLYQGGLRGNDENLKNAGLLAAQHFFGDPGVASGEKVIEGVAPKQKDTKLEQEKSDFRNERYTAFYNDVISACDTGLLKTVVDGIDPRGSMSESMSELLAEKVVKEIQNVLSADNSYVSMMNSLWKRASQKGFPGASKSRIISTYLTRAAEVMPGIRSKIRAAALGIRTKEAGRQEVIKGRKEPTSTVGRRVQATDLSKVDPSKIDWNKTTDEDYINGKITLKKE